MAKHNPSHTHSQLNVDVIFILFVFIPTLCKQSPYPKIFQLVSFANIHHGYSRFRLRFAWRERMSYCTHESVYGLIPNLYSENKMLRSVDWEWGHISLVYRATLIWTRNLIVHSLRVLAVTKYTLYEQNTLSLRLIKVLTKYGRGMCTCTCHEEG